MQFVEVRAERDGYWYDASRYRDVLPTFAGQLPPGARAWATDPDHYDFRSMRCVKDLGLATFSTSPSLTLLLSPNPWKHDQALEVRYESTLSFTFEAGQAAEATVPTVQLDEVLPHQHGCQHEVAFHGGRLVVVAADLTATWVATE